MSYEGYDKYLCASGHLRTCDALAGYYGPPMGDFCSCDKPFVWWCGVDTTNGYEVDDNGKELEPARYPGDVELEIDVAAKVEWCNLGHPHEMEEARYKIPAQDVGHHLTIDAANNLSHAALLDAASEGVALGSCDED